ncbi:MAG: tRNA 2-thiouridine(34) synthase MnmA [Paraprevotella sp.]|nr:tRNA 2-thiouridine(34) synthase MnmA [Paraprevotella sp.]
MKIAVLISGGVDSAVAVHRLCDMGYKPDLFYIKIGMDGNGLSCTAEEDIELSTATARKYGLHLDVVDLQKPYWDLVVGYTMERARKGLTPNPDVMCNKLIKFGCFEQEAGHLYDKIATGHYATIREIDGKTWLGTALDPVKDQTDFLAQIDRLQVSKRMFPVGDLMKEEVRRIADEQHLAPAHRRDSQGICFLGQINYNDFVRRFLGEKEGAVIDIETGKRIGTHKGYWFHTIGQRKGLGLGGGPWFVVKKDIGRNILYVSRGYDTLLQYGHGFNLADFHFITDNPWGDAAEVDVTFKTRHQPNFMKGKLFRAEQGYRLESPERIQGIAPGQFGVIYDADSRICIGSGEIGI